MSEQPPAPTTPDPDDPSVGPPPDRAAPADPPPTADDPRPAAGRDTTADPGPGDQPAGTGSTQGWINLPSRFTGWEFVEQIPDGGQAMLGHYRTPDGRDVVIKFYTRPRHDTRQIWERWQAAGDHPGIVALVGEPLLLDDGRAFEVTPYYELGSLAGPSGGPLVRLAHDELEVVLRQIADALQHIHTLPGGKLLHRDIKPGNLLIAARNEEDDPPIEVRLTDFGIATAQTHTYAARETRSRTVAYASPDSFRINSPQQDWWGLGITLLELHQGRHPFYLPEEGRWRDDGDIQIRLEDPVPIDDEVDDRWRTLFRGLLHRSPQHRWGQEEVQRWLSHDPPPVHEDVVDGARTRRGTPIAFADQVVETPRELARVIAAHWDDAAQDLVLRPERWQELQDWAAAVSPDLGGVLDGLRHRFVGDDRHVDRIVTELVVALDPDGRPSFRGFDADEDGLVELTERATGQPPDTDAQNAVDALLESGALAPLAGLPGCSGLALVDQRWQRWCAEADRIVEAILPDGAELPSRRLLASLLLATAADPTTAQRLAGNAAALATRRNLRVEWFRQLDEGGRGPMGPAYHAVMLLAAGLVNDPRFRVRPETRERVRHTVAQEVPPFRPASAPLARRLRHRAPIVVVAAVYTGLVVAAGVGTAAATSVFQGVLVAVVLLAAGVAPYLGMTRPRERFADALITGWAGAWIGLAVAGAVGALLGVILGPTVGWPAFWTIWIASIALATTLGAAR